MPNETLALGEKICRELGINSHGKTFIRWLCHYLAELIVTEGCATKEERTKIRIQIVDTVRKIWTQRNDLNRDIRSLENLEGIIGVIRFQNERILPNNRS